MNNAPDTLVRVYADYDLAMTGRVISDPARAAMLLRMMDGQAHTATDLARCAGLSASAASSHLRQLVDSRLVAVTVAGRRRLHALSSAEVASAIEALALVSPMLPVESLRQARTGSRLQIARACYSHLGGQLAVAITTALVGAGRRRPVGQPGADRGGRVVHRTGRICADCWRPFVPDRSAGAGGTDNVVPDGPNTTMGGLVDSCVRATVAPATAPAPIPAHSALTGAGDSAAEGSRTLRPRSIPLSLMPFGGS